MIQQKICISYVIISQALVSFLVAIGHCGKYCISQCDGMCLLVVGKWCEFGHNVALKTFFVKACAVDNLSGNTDKKNTKTL